MPPFWLDDEDQDWLEILVKVDKGLLIDLTHVLRRLVEIAPRSGHNDQAE